MQPNKPRVTTQMTDENTQDDVIFGDEEESFNYGDEAENLSNQSDDDGQDRTLINLTEGKTEITFVSEPSHEQWNYGTEDEPDIAEKMVYQVEVDGTVTVDGETKDASEIDDELYYAVTRGKTESSQWGQLVQVGRDRDGLEGETVTIFRNGTGKDTSYLVQDAAELKDE